MEVKKLAAPVGIAAVMISIAAGSVAPASAVNNIKPFGTQETINDIATGGPLIGYTVTGLNPSSDAVPHDGQLYAADIRVDAPGGWATPVIPFFNARAESGANYRVIGGGIPQAPPVGSTTGRLYFDVVGDIPNSVVFNDGTQDLLAWVPGPPEGGTTIIGGGSDAPDVPGESTRIIGNRPADGGSVTGGNLATPTDVTPPPITVNPFETPGQPGRHR
ncbi:MAG: hypothetical protein NVSMB60_03790 [Mycobacterium sp.]